jgi:integrase
VQRQRQEDGTIKPYLKARAEGDTPRDIPVKAFLAGKLAETQADPEGYYFPAHWRKPVQNRFNAARDRAGLPPGFTPHDLRDIFATTLLSKGARLDLVSKLLGHRSVETTAHYYAFWLPSDYDVIRDLL